MDYPLNYKNVLLAGYNEIVQKMLVVLLQKYTDEGPSVLEQAADRRQAQQLLRV